MNLLAGFMCSVNALHVLDLYSVHLQLKYKINLGIMILPPSGFIAIRSVAAAALDAASSLHNNPTPIALPQRLAF